MSSGKHNVMIWRPSVRPSVCSIFFNLNKDGSLLTFWRFTNRIIIIIIIIEHMVHAQYDSQAACDVASIHYGPTHTATTKLRMIFLPAKAWEYVFTDFGLSVCLSVCLSLTAITKRIVDGFVLNFMGRFLGERDDQVRVSLRSVEGCRSKVSKNSVNRRLFTFYTFNSRCGNCCQVLATKTPKFRFCGELYSLGVLSI